RVVRQHHDGRAGRERQVDEPLRDRAHPLAQRAPGQHRPAALAVGLGKGRGLGRLGCPALEPLAHAADKGLQRLGRAQHELAARAVFTHRAAWGQQARIVEEGCLHALSIHMC
ncbi:MAG: hypothetical protein ACK56F_15990, partial [bacterium]